MTLTGLLVFLLISVVAGWLTGQIMRGGSILYALKTLRHRRANSLEEPKETDHACISRRTLAAIAIASGLTAMLCGVSTSAADDKEIANALRAGGLIIVVRHGSTFRDQADTDPLHSENIAAQRQLNDAGKAAARAFGEAFRQIGVPVGEVHTSQFNRAYETAALAGFKDIVKSADITEGGLVVSPIENDRRTAAFRKMLTVAPKPGTNTVIVTHKPNLLDALGKDWFEVKEGEASIFKPEGGSYKLVARVQMDEWPRIAVAK